MRRVLRSLEKAQLPLVRGALAGIALGSLLLHLVSGLSRVWVPTPMDVVELGLVDHVRRVVQGLPAYGEPGVDFVAFVYMPLFYYPSALLARIVGEGFVPLRLVSLSASIVSLWLCYRIVRLETGSGHAGLIAAGLAAALEGNHQWLALARVDSLMGCLILAGAYAMRAARTPAGFVLAGVLFGLGALTKQSAFLVWLPLCLWQTWANRRQGLLFASGFAGTLTLLGAIWQWQSGGWFTYYTVYVATNQDVGDLLTAVRMGSIDVIRTVPFASLVPALLLVKSNRDRVGLPPESLQFYLVVAAGALLTAITSIRLHDSSDNVLLMLCSWLLLVFVICGERIGRLARLHDNRAIELTIATVYVAQFLALAYLPTKILPTAESIETAGTRVATVSGNPRNQEMVTHWLDSSPLDPAAYADGIAVRDLLKGGSPAVTQSFEARVRAALCRATPSNPVVIDAGLLSLESRTLSMTTEC